MDYETVLCTVASNDYLIYLERLLASVKIYIPKAKIHITLVNVDQLIEPYLKNIYENIVIDYEYIKYTDINLKKAYCANKRASLFPELMKKYDCPIMWIDVDSIFTKPADELLDFASKYDFSAQYASNHRALKANKKKLRRFPKGPLGTPFYGIFSTGIITTNNSSIAKKFFKRYKEIVNKSPYAWYADQEGMYLTYREFYNDINFCPLDDKFCSRKIDDNTVIWTAKGNIKYSEKYAIEADKFLLKIKEWPGKDLDALNVNLFSLLHEESMMNKVMNMLRRIIEKINKVIFVKKLIRKFINVLLTKKDNRIYIQKSILDFSKSFKKDAKILDIGSRKSSYIRFLREVLVDKNIITSDLFQGEGIDQILDATNLPFEDNSLDGIICTEVLEHVYNYMDIINECYRVLKKDGIMLVTVPYYFNIHSKPGMPDYFRFTDQALEKMFSKFKRIKIVPFGNNIKKPFGYAVYINGK